MAKYEILFRMLSDVRSVMDTRGNFLEHDVIVRTAHWSLETNLESGCFRVEGDYSDTYLTMDFPDDDAAIAWALSFNRLHLDPWRVDWIFGPDGEDVFTR